MTLFMASIEQELKEIAAESIGWLPLSQGAYLHLSCDGKEERVIITGVPDAGMDAENVLLLL
ncbi:MAG: hypothetical protein WCL48_03170 [Betaproteobacteria bacterium]|jgi:hypothetical protein